jgi:dCTP deaminase
MALLSKKAILAALDSGSLQIDPRPLDTAYGTDSVDAHLGDAVYHWKRGQGGATTAIRVGAAFDYKTFARANLEKVPQDPDGVITFRPGTFYLADLLEYTRLPPDLAMHVQGKSSLARLGLGVHVTAPHAHAGWSGRLTLEIFNYGPYNIEVTPHVEIAQLSFWRVESPLSPDELPTQQFTNQRNASGES